MSKNSCGIRGYETVCVNGCCETAVFTDCQMRAKRQLRKAHRRK